MDKGRVALGLFVGLLSIGCIADRSTQPPVAMRPNSNAFDGGGLPCTTSLAANGVPIVNPGDTPLHLIGNSPALSPTLPAIVLVHGWSSSVGTPMDYCDAQVRGELPGENYFTVLIANLRTIYPDIPILVYDYPSYLSWRASGTPLAAQLTALVGQTSGFVIVAHSMGGMVSDTAIASLSGPAKRTMLGLVTLGTPHEGTQLGSKAAKLASYFVGSCHALSIFTVTQGLCSQGTASLEAGAPYKQVLAAKIPIYAHGGLGPIQPTYVSDPRANPVLAAVLYPISTVVLGQQQGGGGPALYSQNDGVVPLYSALLSSQTGNQYRHVFTWPKWDHSDLGVTSLPGDGSVFFQVKANIDEILAQPSQLRFTTSVPSSTNVGTVLPPIVVGVYDALGRLVSIPSPTIRLRLLANNTFYPLSNAASTVAAGGLATFSGVAIPQAGHFTLEADETGERLQHASTPIAVGALVPPPPAPEGGNWSQVASGWGHTCALSRGGVAYCWGDNYFGEIGDGLGNQTTLPTKVLTTLTFTSIVAGGGIPINMGSHSCALSASGDAYCWGANEAGQLGEGLGNVFESVPVPVAGGYKFKQLTAGRQHTCGLTVANEAYCWGDGFGLGMIVDNPILAPMHTAAGITFQSLSAGGSYTCGLATSGDVYCWGFGLGVVNAQIPTIVAPASLGVTSIAASRWTGFPFSATGAFLCVHTSGGEVQCLGDNFFGEMGNGSQSPVPQGSFAAVLGGTSFSSVSAGWVQNCALSGSRALCWGRGSLVGNGGTANQLVPAPVVNGASPTTLAFQSLSVGAAATCGVTTAHDIWCWGDNTFGQLGQGSRSGAVLEPVKVGFRPAH
jgi:alpha-tubulin suppressor-like RCC1 family protein